MPHKIPYIIKKTITSFRYEGFSKTILKVIRHSGYLIGIHPFKNNVLLSKDTEAKFTWIYKENHWGSNESLSGYGSTLKYTKNLRKELPSLLKHYSISKIFDAPCGDFNWMSYFLQTNEIKYIGGDIVSPLIEKLNKNYGNLKTSFIHINLIEESFPKADLMICRDCLFHLSYDDTVAVLKNFVNSGTPYILTTTYNNSPQWFSNEDIVTGDFRLIDLLTPPYNFPTPLEIIDDFLIPDPKRHICLWSREQVLVAVNRFNQR